MKTKLNIKNFRIFDEKGVTFEINPITILTGANSSGKSSMVKAVFLLNSFLSQIKADLDKGEEVKLDKYKLDFSTYPNNLLGRFDKVVHNGSKSKTVTFEYTVYSLMLSKDVTVQLVFSADENDELNNAYLEKISFSTKEGVFYSCDKEGTYSHSFSGLKDAFLEYLLIEADVHALSNAWIDYNLSRKDNNQPVGKLIDKLSSVNQSRYRDALNYVRSKTKNGKEERPIVPQELVESVVESDSMFRVPVLDVLSRVSKSEIKSFIESNYLINWIGYGLYFASKVVIDDFVNSEFDDFKSYYEDFEKRFLSSCVVPSKNQYSDFTPDYYLRKHYSKIHLSKHDDFDLFNSHLMFINTDYFEDDFESYVEDVKLKALLQEGFKEWGNVPATFELVYSCVMAWNDEFSKDKNESCVFSCDEIGIYTVYHTVFRAFAFLMEDLVSETICPDWCENVSYVSSARANILRLYSLDGNDDFTKLLKDYFESKRSYLIRQKEIPDDYFKMNEKRDYVPDSFINRWVEKFGIGKSISFEIDREGLGVQIRLYKTDNDEGRLLADEGYGITQLVSVLLQIETAIISAKGIKVKSPGLPNNVDDFDYHTFRYEPQTITIEEPEIHLHPKYQSLLADMFLEAYEKYNIHFIIETHSEYLIRRTQVFVSQAKYKSKRAMKEKNPFKVYYVPEGGKPYDLGFKTTGRFENSFGEGFFDEAGRLALNLSKYDKTDGKIDIDWTNI